MHQQPEYPDGTAVREAANELSQMPPLVFAGECRNLQSRLAKCATGESFWLQGRRLAVFLIECCVASCKDSAVKCASSLLLLSYWLYLCHAAIICIAASALVGHNQTISCDIHELAIFIFKRVDLRT